MNLWNKISFQFEIQKLHVINKIKCLTWNSWKLWKTLFDQTTKISYTVTVWYEYSWKQRLLLKIYFKNFMGRKQLAKLFRSLLILTVFQILNMYCIWWIYQYFLLNGDTGWWSMTKCYLQMIFAFRIKFWKIWSIIQYLYFYIIEWFFK